MYVWCVCCVCVRESGKREQIYLLYRRRILAPGHARHVLMCPLLVMLGENDATQTQKHHACIRIGTLCFFLLLYLFFSFSNQDCIILILLPLHSTKQLPHGPCPEPSYGIFTLLSSLSDDELQHYRLFFFGSTHPTTIE